MLLVKTVLVVALYVGTLNRTSARVIKTQPLDVDGISGATISTKAVLKAVDNALAARP